MKLTSKHDLAISSHDLAAGLENFSNFEKLAVRRGAEVTRQFADGAPVVGAQWNVRFFMRGKMRNVQLTLKEWDRGSHILFHLKNANMEGTLCMDIQALAPARSRLIVTLEVQPKSMTARLLVQSLRLVKGRVQRKFDRAISQTYAAFDREVTAS